ncbi:hypothetical protein EIP86_009251 [Pleurotus ostreatoroseus]|nr:hypothetical protein EIP86_009251 [Pleurotus ostreatoroseus]
MNGLGKARLWYTAAEASAGARLSYHLNLTGPSMEVKTACSSSAVAIHQACMAVRNGDCEGAIVVASTTFFAAPTAVFRMQAGIGSPSGRCATFSDNADGFLPSEGAAAIVIQRSADISGSYYARIRGTAVVQDGRSLGFSAPNPEAQVRLLQAGLKNAACAADDVSYIEAHGTGTPVGDVVEFNSIRRVYSQARTRPLVVGSVKAVIGHTEECAGLAGVLKSVLCFKNGIVPPQPHIRSLNPDIDLERCRAIIPRSVHGFASGSRKRIISISSFGLSGTLANIILEEPRTTQFPPETDSNRKYLFTLSARSENDFRALLQRYAAYCESEAIPEISLRDACRTTQVGRDHFLYRRAWAVSRWRDVRLCLQSPQASQSIRALNNPGVSIWFTLPHPSHRLPLISHPVFAMYMQECRTSGCTPALEPFAEQIALIRTLQYLGCHVSAAGGEGIAEYCAAASAGIITLRTLFGLLGSLKPVSGRSWVIDLSREDVEEYLLDYPPDEVRIVGGGEEISYLHTRSPGSETIKEDIGSSHFKEAHPLTYASYCKDARHRLQPSSPTIGVVSAYIGDILDEEYLGERYWLDLPQQTFDITAAQRRLATDSDVVLLMSHGTQSSALQSAKIIDVGDSLEHVVGKLYELGFPINWSLYASAGPTCHLPTYVWASTVP